MAGNRFQVRRGTSVPTTSDLLVGELGLNLNTGFLYTKNSTPSIVLLNPGASADGNVAMTIANTAPGSPSAGDLWWHNEQGRLKIWYVDADTSQWVDVSPIGPTGPTGPLGPKAMSIPAPVNTDIPTLFHTNTALTIAEIRTVVRGSSTPSVTATYYWGADRSGTGNTVIQATIVTTNVTSGNIQTSFSNSTPAANSWLWFNITAVSGTVDEYAVTLRFN
jgi:hypothetical protein